MPTPSLRTLSHRSLLVSAIVLAIWGSAALPQSVAAQTSDRIVIFAPERQEYDLALDELELIPAAGGPARSARSTVEVAGARVLRRQENSTVFRVNAPSRNALIATARTLSGANPGTRTALVLYLPKQPRNEETRRVMTGDVAVLLNAGADPAAFRRDQQRYSPENVAGLANAFVLVTDDAEDALDLSDALRQRGDVQTAYPLLGKKQFSR